MTKVILFGIIVALSLVISGCTDSDPIGGKVDAAKYCDDDGVVAVFECPAGSAKVISTLVGEGGFIIHRNDGSSVECPTVNPPDDLSDTCYYYLHVDCSDQDVCMQ